PTRSNPPRTNTEGRNRDDHRPGVTRHHAVRRHRELPRLRTAGGRRVAHHDREHRPAGRAREDRLRVRAPLLHALRGSRLRPTRHVSLDSALSTAAESSTSRIASAAPPTTPDWSPCVTGTITSSRV